MHDKMAKLMALKKKKGDEMSPAEKEAKGNVIRDMMSMADDAMKDKLHGLKKVTVASNDEAGLQHGLDKAKEIVSGPEHDDMVEDAEDGNGRDGDIFAGSQNQDEEGEGEEESPEHEAMESPEEEAGEHGMSEDEVDAKLAELMKIKKGLQSKKA